MRSWNAQLQTHYTSIERGTKIIQRYLSFSPTCFNLTIFFIDNMEIVVSKGPIQTIDKRTEICTMSNDKRSLMDLFTQLKLIFDRMKLQYETTMSRHNIFRRYFRLKSIIKEVIRCDISTNEVEYKYIYITPVQSVMSSRQQSTNSRTQVALKTEGDLHDLIVNLVKSDDQIEREFEQLKMEITKIQHRYVQLSDEIDRMKSAYYKCRRRTIFAKYRKFKKIIITALSNSAIEEPLDLSKITKEQSVVIL